jgi:hypothetical protein
MSGPTEEELAERARYIDGLRVLAAVLEQNPGIRLPMSARYPNAVVFLFQGDGAREEMAAAARAFPCSWQKHTTTGGGTEFFDLVGQLAGLGVELSAPRELVCERVVTGTEKRPVEKVVTPAVVETVVEDVEVVEWRCHSLLAPAALDGP